MQKKNNKYLYGWKLYVNEGNGYRFVKLVPGHAGNYFRIKECMEFACPFDWKWSYGRIPNPAYRQGEKP